MWDERYGSEDYVYGTEPNDFLREHVQTLPPGRILCLAEGEGRNAVFLAERGYQVHALDASSVGLRKADQLAKARRVAIETQVLDLSDWAPVADAYQGIVSIFCHLPRELRRRVLTHVKSALAPGGVLLLEAYTPRQLDHKTGGPPTLDLLYEPEELRAELDGLTIERLEEVTRDVVEGKLHTGKAAVVQVIARRPA